MPEHTEASLDMLNHHTARQRIIDLTTDVEQDMTDLVTIIDRLVAARDAVAETGGEAHRAAFGGSVVGAVIGHTETLATTVRDSYFGKALPAAREGRDA